MESLCCSDVKGYKDRPNANMHEPKFLAFLEAYPNISQNSGSANAKYNFIIQLAHHKGTSDQERASKRFFACQDVVKNTVELPPPPPQLVAREPANQPQDPAPAPAPMPALVPPYRPRIATAVPEPRKAPGPWGSGWTQRSAGPSQSSSYSSWGSNNSGGGGNSSNPRRTNSNGPPSWVSPDVADSKSSWRSNARRPSASSTTPSTSPISPRSPGGGRGPSSYFAPPRSIGDTRRGVFGSVKAPSSVASQSEKDTSAWESASNATDATWTNRFAMLDGESVDDSGISDTSEGMDSERLREIAGFVTQDDDDDDDYPLLVPGPTQSTSGRWQKTGPIRFVEISEADVRRSGMRRNHHHKMYRCLSHNAVWTLHVYVPLEEEDAV